MSAATEYCSLQSVRNAGAPTPVRADSANSGSKKKLTPARGAALDCPSSSTSAWPKSDDLRELPAVDQHVSRMNVAVKDTPVVRLAIRPKNGAGDVVQFATRSPNLPLGETRRRSSAHLLRQATPLSHTAESSISPDSSRRGAMAELSLARIFALALDCGTQRNSARVTELKGAELAAAGSTNLDKRPYHQAPERSARSAKR